MKKYSLLLLATCIIHAQEQLDDDTQRKIYNVVQIRDLLQVGSFIVTGNGFISSLSVTGNGNINGSLNVGALTIKGVPVTAGGSGGGTGGSGNVVGPSSSTQNAVALFANTTGKLIEQSANNPVNSAPVIIDSSTNMTNVNNVTITADLFLPITSFNRTQGAIQQTRESQTLPILHTYGPNGSNNIAVGAVALNSLDASTPGNDNAACGFNALGSLTTGSFNTAVGASTLSNEGNGSDNTAVGYNSLTSSSGNSQNTAVGSNALANFDTGSGNVALGYFAGDTLQSGSNNIYIGNNGGTNTESNITRIGSQSSSTGSCFIGGIAGVTVTGSAVLVSSSGQLGVSSSSAQYKKDITSMESVATALMKLRPVRFRYKIHDDTVTPEYGLIAEEVAQIMPDLVIYKDGKPETVKYHVLPAILIKALQELATQNNEQQIVIEQLIQRVATLESRAY